MAAATRIKDSQSVALREARLRSSAGDEIQSRMFPISKRKAYLLSPAVVPIVAVRAFRSPLHKEGPGIRPDRAYNPTREFELLPFFQRVTLSPSDALPFAKSATRKSDMRRGRTLALTTLISKAFPLPIVTVRPAKSLVRRTVTTLSL
jgi:hypothetical protein